MKRPLCEKAWAWKFRALTHNEPPGHNVAEDREGELACRHSGNRLICYVILGVHIHLKIIQQMRNNVGFYFR